MAYTTLCTLNVSTHLRPVTRQSPLTLIALAAVALMIGPEADEHASNGCHDN